MIFQKTKWNPVIKPTLFGVYWDGTTNSSMLRTDGSALFEDPVPAVSNGTGSSPFDEYMPWAGMEIVEDAEAGTLVSIPKFWYKWTRDSEVTGDMKLQISNKEIVGFHVSPAHADRGDGEGERDVVYVGRYHCSSSDYKSVTGKTPRVQTARATFRTQISGLGDTIWQWDFAMYWTICMLYLVEYASWDSQTKIGYGCSNTTSLTTCGLTDAMLYHTGTNVSIKTGRVQYRHIEDLWSNVLDWVDGIYFDGTSKKYVYIIKNPENFGISGGKQVGLRTTSNGFISAWNNPTESGYEWAIYPSAAAGSDSTYVRDRVYYHSSNGVSLSVGGNFNTRSLDAGLFYMYGYTADTNVSPMIGSRLMKLP